MLPPQTCLIFDCPGIDEQAEEDLQTLRQRDITPETEDQPQEPDTGKQ